MSIHQSGETVGLWSLASLRADAGYTQSQLSDALGVTRSAVAMWETGKSLPSAALLPKMADLLLCSIDQLYLIPKKEGAQ